MSQGVQMFVAVVLSGKKEAGAGRPRRRRRKEGEGEDGEEGEEDEEEEEPVPEPESKVVSDDGIFKVMCPLWC